MTITVEFETLGNRTAEFSALMRDHAKRTMHEEPGCISFDVVQPSEIDGRPVQNRFLIIEIYADEAAVAAHENSPRLTLVREAIRPMLKSRRRILAKQIDGEAEDQGMTPDELNAANDD